MRRGKGGKGERGQKERGEKGRVRGVGTLRGLIPVRGDETRMRMRTAPHGTGGVVSAPLDCAGRVGLDTDTDTGLETDTDWIRKRICPRGAERGGEDWIGDEYMHTRHPGARGREGGFIHASLCAADATGEQNLPCHHDRMYRDNK